ncbi:SIS domain-containing protein [Phyllobacterium sp. SYP-B3895]|uniref:MurR/RpiR family transcriptional regulator n=1 Tax=Phyllobacterium pellucidum TaxID=2740464 RepID=A0A849VV80_9HYPH|nr:MULTISPECIES: MurR/RpiR family transcriptional regulator [Phyllobacterium]MRG56550.1 SIS domain-containing protein [Phyllobacterium sp. SYP-B3895]NTS32087.1 MurR/RpiR family transcriptional regulator [Phyllobacterium pellucidum]UGY09509.1 MurR/RpiR family transcriptional regulator [Phyllobacterium sp. T1018]SFJ36958.1 DNA-binding transcriptional regulator, MurR/RpiR family, contains HTH and SIS domains [Phyllobacterium sp. CL33Tsu]
MDNEAALPRDFDALRTMILDRREVLPKRLAQIAAYALSNPDEIAFGTAASIAQTAGVQPSTLIRFAQHLGFDGFTSLQAVFRERLRERQTSYEERLSALRGDTHGLSKNRTILNGFLTAATHSIETISHNVEEDVLERAVDILSGAETIYLLARRRSYPITAYMAYAFGKLKIRNQLIESTAGIDPEIISFAGPRDAAIAISFSPYASATIEHAAALSARNVPVVAITDSAFSPLAQSASVWFEAAEGDFSGFRSLSGTMALAMALTVSVAEKRRNT